MIFGYRTKVLRSGQRSHCYHFPAHTQNGQISQACFWKHKLRVEKLGWEIGTSQFRATKGQKATYIGEYKRGLGGNLKNWF